MESSASLTPYASYDSLSRNALAPAKEFDAASRRAIVQPLPISCATLVPPMGEVRDGLLKGLRVRSISQGRSPPGSHQFVIEKKVSAGMDTLNAPPTTEISAACCKFNKALVW